MAEHERDLQGKCLGWLKSSHPDILVANIHGGGWSAKGFPDLICCIKGQFVAFELKVGLNGMQADQKVWRNRIIKAGGLHYSPYTLDEFMSIIEDILLSHEIQEFLQREGLKYDKGRAQGQDAGAGSSCHG